MISKKEIFNIHSALFIGAILLCLLHSCSGLSIVQETKHPGMYLKCKTKVVCENDTNYFVILKIKNIAKKTSYNKMDVMIQVFNEHDDSACFVSRVFNSPVLKPHHKQIIRMPLFCPGQKPSKVTIHNLYGSPVK
jgi:hypothetical protein